jgi:hypothetical protein
VGTSANGQFWTFYNVDRPTDAGLCAPAAKARMFSYSYPRLRSHFALLLISILVLTQTPRAYSIEVSAPGASNVDSCSTANSDFKADLKRLSEAIKETKDIPQEFLQRHFAGCTIENARKLLVKNGFAADELGPGFNDSEPEKVIPRRMMAAKTIRPVGQLGSFNCRIILQTDTSNRIKAQGFFYFDGP